MSSAPNPLVLDAKLALSVDLAGETERAHEGLILATNEMLVATRDPRYFDIVRTLVAMRTEAQVRRMEGEMGIA